jgi:hypothetical protein
MYAWPITLPIQSNREDLLQTVSLFDDDTGTAIDISGRTLAGPGDFTASAWTVRDGTIVTASVTPLTIKDYPIQNEMQATTLTVGLNLGILAGDLITIADATGLNTMTGYVTSYAPQTGALVVQVGSAFDLEIRGRHNHHGGCDYGPFSAVGTDNVETPLITAQLGSGISVIDVGVLQIRIPAATVNKLRHKSYGAALVMFDGYDTRQIYIATLPMLYGGIATNAFSPQSTSSNPFGLP